MILEIVVLALAIPAGFLLAWLARDELKDGKKWFRIIILVGVFVGGWFYLTGERYVTWSAGFIIIVSFIALMKSEDKKWVKSKIIA